MKKLASVTAGQVREVDRIAVNQYGFQAVQMMESAGRALARLCRLVLGGRVVGRSIIVLAGGGKNAGGGLAAARILNNWGAGSEVVLAAREDALKRSVVTQLNILESMGVNVSEPGALTLARVGEFDLIIDALIDYGAQGDPNEEIAHAISVANRSKKPIVSLDVPSGLDATTGTAYDPCVTATVTLALALPKTGLLEERATKYVGELWLADIGIPPEIYAQIGVKGDNPFVDDDLVLLHRRKKAVGITA